MFTTTEVSERPSAKREIPLEANPKVMSQFAWGLGIPKEEAFSDVYGYDDELLDMMPKPVLTIIFLYPLNDAAHCRETGRCNNKLDLLLHAMDDLWRSDTITIDREHGDHRQVFCLANLFLERQFSSDILIGVLNLLPARISPFLYIDRDMHGLVEAPIIAYMPYICPDLTERCSNNNLIVELEAEDSFQICAKILDGRTLLIRVRKDFLVLDLKREIYKRTDIPLEMQSLICVGRSL